MANIEINGSKPFLVSNKEMFMENNTKEAESCCSSKNPIFQTTIRLLDDNINHFTHDDSEHGQRLFSGLVALKDGLLQVALLSEIIRKEASSYDFSPSVPGNGFRSFSNLSQQSVICVFELCKKISSSRGSLMMFRKKHYVQEIEAWGQTMASLTTILEYLTQILMPRCENGSIMPDVEYSPTELFTLLNTVSQYSFYGRCLAFHYHEALQKTMRFLNIGMCAFSEVYYSDGGFLQRTKQSVFTGSKYLMDPDQRARRIVDVVQYSSVDFIKSFWSLADTDLLTQLPGIVGPSLKVQQMILVPCEDAHILSLEDLSIIIPAPCSHLPPSPIPCHLLSSAMREGMPGERQWKGKILPPSDQIIFHCHGGGFVTQSTKSQEVFLRDWAVALQVPIFSVDYSLAPDAKYPRPLEEVMTSYIWMLNNFKLLGTSGEKVICTGDSAGGNLLSALTIKCLELKVRLPDGLFLAYVPFSVKLTPTPARLLAVMDPMLPLGFALRCLKAYAGLPSNRVTPATSPDDNSSSSIASSSNLDATPEHSSIDHTLNATQTKKKIKRLKQKSSKKTSSKIVTQAAKDPPPDILNGDVVQTVETIARSADSAVSESDTDTMTTVSLTSDPLSKREEQKGACEQEVESKEDRSRKYVSEFLEKYVLDSRIDKDGRKVPILRTGSEDEIEDECFNDDPASASATSIGAKFEKAKEAMLDGLSTRLSSFKLRRNKSTTATPPSSPKEEMSPTKVVRRPSFGKINLGTTKLRRDSACSLLEEFVGVELMDDYYLSPLTASTNLLAQFPPTSIMTVEYDFCLDDCITMAKCLRSLGVSVTLDVLARLPHGFLNLNLVSKESHEGCKIAIERLKQLLAVDQEEVPKA